MKKFYRIFTVIMLVLTIGIFFALSQFPSEDGTTDGYTIYEMNDDWQFVCASSVMKDLESHGGTPNPGMNPPGTNPEPDGAHSQYAPDFMAEWTGYQGKLTGVFGIEAPEDRAEMEDASITCAQ